MNDFRWEQIHVSNFQRITERAKVFGGWIVCDWTAVSGHSGTQSMVFVPDPNHEWEIKDE